MAEIEKTVFEFPDEAEGKNPREGGRVIAADPDPVVEVVDDTPPRDRNRTPMAEMPVDPTDDELDSYSESAKKRIKHFTKGYHEERRAKESALREREEAVRMAESVIAENKRLQGSLSQGQTALLEQAKKTVARELDDAKQKYKAAYEAGDADALVAAQEAMTTSKMKAEKINNFKPAPLPKETPVVQTPRSAPVDTKAQDWQAENDWFGTDRKMTAYALSVHEDLVANGVSTSSDEYFKAINDDMRKRFPEKFDSDDSADASTQRTTKRNVVAPATRSTAPRKVVLTQTQVNLAKRLGVPLELYARKVAEEMRK